MPFAPGSLMVHLSLASLLGLAWASAIISLFRISQPASRASLFAGSLVAPLVGFLFHTIVPHDCLVSRYSGYWSHVACLMGNWLGRAGVLVAAAGLTVVFSQTVATLLACRRLASGARPADTAEFLRDPSASGVMAALQDICRLARVKVPRLMLTARQGVCCTIGIMRPSLLLSRNLCEDLEPGELRAILAHEIAHMMRHDNALGLIAGVLRALTFFSPAAHFALAGYLAEREKAADDLAVRFAADPLALASGLVKAYRAREQRLIPRPLTGIAAVGEGLSGRLNRLIAPAEAPRPWQMALVLLGGAGLFGIALSLC